MGNNKRSPVHFGVRLCPTGRYPGAAISASRTAWTYSDTCPEASESSRGQPHSKTCRNFASVDMSPSVLECGCPLPLSAGAEKVTDRFNRNPWPLLHCPNLVVSLLLLAFLLLAPPLRAQILPPPPASQTMPVRMLVREFRFVGNKVFSQSELATVTASFTNRTITSGELEDARRAVTVYYVSHGYINSGAIIPDQDPANGIITIRVVEGVLSHLNVHGNKWLRDSYITNRLQRWSGPPLNMGQLQD